MRIPFRIPLSRESSETPGGRHMAAGVPSQVDIDKIAQLVEIYQATRCELLAAQEVVTFLSNERERLRGALSACMRNDGTASYEYGEVRCRDGKRPLQGDRWLTPHEIAKGALER